MTIVAGALALGSAVGTGAVGRAVDVAVGRPKKTLASGTAAGFGGGSMPSSNGSAPRQARATAIQRRRRRRRPTSRAGAGRASVGVTGFDIATGFLTSTYGRPTHAGARPAGVYHHDITPPPDAAA